MKSKLIIQMH